MDISELKYKNVGELNDLAGLRRPRRARVEDRVAQLDCGGGDVSDRRIGAAVAGAVFAVALEPRRVCRRGPGADYLPASGEYRAADARGGAEVARESG